jgi:hypothetical protein
MDARMGRRLRPTSMTLVKNRREEGDLFIFLPELLPGRLEDYISM